MDKRWGDGWTLVLLNLPPPPDFSSTVDNMDNIISVNKQQKGK